MPFKLLNFLQPPPVVFTSLERGSGAPVLFIMVIEDALHNLPEEPMPAMRPGTVVGVHWCVVGR